jgi:hypothetical protein
MNWTEKYHPKMRAELSRQFCQAMDSLDKDGGKADCLQVFAKFMELFTEFWKEHVIGSSSFIPKDFHWLAW